MQFISSIDQRRYNNPKLRKIPDLLNKGAILMKEGRFEDALKIYDKSLEIDPDDPNVLLNKGVVYSQLGEYDKALSHYDTVLRDNPDYYMAQYNKAGTLAVMGQTEESLVWLQRVIDNDPRFAKMAQEDDDFSYLWPHPKFKAIVSV